MRLRNSVSIDAAITSVQSLRNYLDSTRNASHSFGPEDPFLTWCDDQARPQLQTFLVPTEELPDELEVSYNRINLAPKANLRRLNAMLSREYLSWHRRLGEVVDELNEQKKLASRPGTPVVLDTSALMEGEPLVSFDWHSLDSSLATGPVRLVVPILVVEELDDLLHDRDGARKKKARDASRALRELHKARPTEPAPLPNQQDVTVEVLLDGDWHRRRPNNDTEIIDQALSLRDQIAKPVLLGACDLPMMYRAAAAGLPSVLVPRADGQAQTEGTDATSQGKTTK